MEKTIILQPDRKNVEVNGTLVPVSKIFADVIADNSGDYFQSLQQQLRKKKYLTDKQVYWLMNAWKIQQQKVEGGMELDPTMDNCQGMENPHFTKKD
jgi:hypothetical protein